jgi:hypothetical protein
VELIVSGAAAYPGRLLVSDEAQKGARPRRDGPLEEARKRANLLADAPGAAAPSVSERSDGAATARRMIPGQGASLAPPGEGNGLRADVADRPRPRPNPQWEAVSHHPVMAVSTKGRGQAAEARPLDRPPEALGTRGARGDPNRPR